MWRLARQLTTHKNWQVRLWVDKLEALAAMEPALDPGLPHQQCREIEVHRWAEPFSQVTPNPVVIAGFSCDLPDTYVTALAQMPQVIWLQLEYLSAQQWVSDFHGRSALRTDGLRPVFFFPGFNEQTGGLLLEPDLQARQAKWSCRATGPDWLASLGVVTAPGTRLVSVFTYPNAPLEGFVAQMSQVNQRFHLLLPKGQRAPNLSPTPNVTWQTIDFLSQDDYDRLLWCCDLNLVRGEDSWVRAIWAAKPMIWQAYYQCEDAHHPKIDAWCALAQLPAPLPRLLHEWADGQIQTDLSSLLTGSGWQHWCQASSQLSQRLAKQTDLASRIDLWCRKPPHLD